jgi:predicted acyl esterase
MSDLYQAQSTYIGCTSERGITKFDSLLENNVMVPMRDGIRLVTDIYRRLC